MILIWLIAVLMIAGLAAWALGKRNPLLSRVLVLIALGIDLALSLAIWLKNPVNFATEGVQWIREVSVAWIPTFGVRFHLGMDGLSLMLVTLTLFLGILSVLASWSQVTKRVGFFHFNLLWILAGIIGVFLSLDLFLFYFFWEVMLIPMYFLIAIWGYEKRIYAAYKFFIFTQAGGLLMFLSILGLYFVHGEQTGVYTFGYEALLNTVLDSATGFWLMLGFLIAFAVKLPLIPFHSWLPDAHTQAPTAGSVILAGLLLKTGAYGILRFAIPFFPDAAATIGPYVMGLGVISILYGAKLAFAQTDLKRLVAYTSVSHMGFVVLGAFAFNELAYQGVVLQMIAHGISTGALFVIVGIIQERLKTRNVDEMGGLWSTIPKTGAMTLVFVMALLGLPGLGNFVAEFLILLGAFSADKFWAIVATASLVASAIYALRLMQKVFYGPLRIQSPVADLNFREGVIMLALLVSIVWLGLYPGPVINRVEEPIRKILNKEVDFTSDRAFLPTGHYSEEKE